MRIAIWIFFLVALTSAVVVAQTEAPDRGQELDGLIATYTSEMKAYQALPENERGASPWKTYPATFLAFAKSNSDEASLRACEYIILNFYIADERYAAIDLATEHHRDKPLFCQFLGNLVYKYDDDKAVDDCLGKLAASQSKTLKAIAAYQQAHLLVARRKWLADEPDRYNEIFDAEYIAELQSAEARIRIENLLAQVIAANPQVTYLGKPLVERAKQDLFEIQGLEVGCPVPEIKGRDSQGKSLAISDYRGSVVVVTFWAGWCGPCIADLPQEITFVKEMNGRPFVWLGVNGDGDVEQLRELEKTKGINFRSWHDGEDGPIAKMFNVHGWPKMYVVDQNGIIRYKSGVSVELDSAKKAIESLVVAAESEKGITK